MIKVSAVIITYNEESNIARAVQSVSWCDEVVVVDSNSTDKTAEIATAAGARVVFNDFEGYGQQKNFAVSEARNEWVLSLDADEEIGPRLREEILQALENNTENVGYYLPRTLVFLGKPMKFGRESKEKIIRLFDKNHGEFNTPEVHESVQVNGKTATLRNRFLHYSYNSVADYFDRFNKYTSLGAEELYKRGRRASILNILFRYPFSFIAHYIFKGNVLNGFRGFVWALFSACYSTVKHIKLYEIQTNRKS